MILIILAAIVSFFWSLFRFYFGNGKMTETGKYFHFLRGKNVMWPITLSKVSQPSEVNSK